MYCEAPTVNANSDWSYSCLWPPKGNSDCVQLMIDQGALMEAHDCHYGTPLHVACARQHYDCVKVLLNAGECMFSLPTHILIHISINLKLELFFF